jgi:hypothetical protein
MITTIDAIVRRHPIRDQLRHEYAVAAEKHAREWQTADVEMSEFWALVERAREDASGGDGGWPSASAIGAALGRPARRVSTGADP